MYFTLVFSFSKFKDWTRLLLLKLILVEIEISEVSNLYNFFICLVLKNYNFSSIFIFLKNFSKI